jgi:O-antigen/teichoic acid export membrane protein
MSASTITKNSLWSFIDLFVSLVFALVSSVAVARLMGPEKLGYYNYILWILSIAALLGMLGIPMATLKYAAEYLGREDPRCAIAIIRLTGRIQTSSALAVTGVGVVLTLLYSPPDHRAYTLIGLLSMLPLMLMGVFTQANIAAQEFRSNATASLISNLANFAGVMLVLWRGWDLVGLTASLLAGRLIDFAIRYRSFLGNYGRLGISWPGFLGSSEDLVPAETKRRILRFCGQSFLLQCIEALVWNRPQVLLLKRLCPIQQVTFYTLGFNLTERAVLLPRAFMSAITANLMVQFGQDASSVAGRTATSIRYIALLSLPMLLGLSAISRPLIQIMYGTAYLPAAVPLAILAASGVFRVALLPIRSYLAAMELQRIQVYWTVLGALVNIGVSFWWIPRAGAQGGAWASAVTQLFTAAGIWLTVARRFPLPLRGRSLAGLTLAALVMAALVAGIGLLVATPAALVLGLSAGVVTYPLLLRAFRGLDCEDRPRLLSILGKVPPPWRRYLTVAVRFVCR